MLSHDNIIYAAEYVIQTVKVNMNACERIVSFLPLSHIAAQLFDCYIAVYVGATIYYAQPDAMRGSLGSTLVQVKPTVFFGVPRVWEKMQEKMEQMAKISNGKISNLVITACKFN